MGSVADFTFEPLPPIEESATPTATAPTTLAAAADPLGQLAGLAGNWTGRGFNVIWRPHPLKPGGQDRFLELNVTSEQLDFGRPCGTYPTVVSCSPTSAWPG